MKQSPLARRTSPHCTLGPSVRNRLCAALLALLAASLPSATVLADDTADEADLQFQIAAERYQAGDYRAALEHFLASNRLVPNKNVLFNIAKTFEQLGRLPDAYRYYALALEGENDASTRQKVSDALTKLRERVAVVVVKTEPAGATVYLDRKDLGSRGSTPKQLGLASGTYRVIVEMPGYEPVELTGVQAKVGQITNVELKLVRIVGTLDVRTQAGAQIRVDHDDGAPDCIAPCKLPVGPGRRTVYVSKPGFQRTETIVDVVAKQTVTRDVGLTALSGNVVVNADVPNALITVDGEPKGFTPTVLSVPVGPHLLKVSAQGYREQERKVEVLQSGQTSLDFDLSSSEEVTAASRTNEAIEDAPASVSTVSGQELRAMGYPTIAEAIRGVRGIYLSNDDVYISAGVRGFANPGSYGNRILVLVDGHPTNDNYIWSSYLAYDARADLEDVERIEIVRGAGSVLYGTGAFFGVINVITRSRNAPSHAELGVSTALGAGRARAHMTWRASPDAGVWLSASGTRAQTSDKFYPEFVGKPQGTGLSDGFIRNADDHVSGFFGGRIWYKALTLQGSFNSHDKNSASAQFQTQLGVASRNKDSKAFLEARFEPQLAKTFQSLTRAHFNYYGYDNVLPYAKYDRTDAACTANAKACDYGTETDRYRGLWAGAEQRFQWTPNDRTRVTVGGEVIQHFRTLQVGDDDRSIPFGAPGGDANIPRERLTGSIIRRDDPFTSFAGYMNADIPLGSRLRVSAGARIDHFTNILSKFDFLEQFNPRLAVVAKIYDGGTTKVIAGKAFRAPSVYESYYIGTTQIESKGLRPEQVYSAELEHTHRFSPTVAATAAGYANYVTKLIELNRDVSGGVKQYQNSQAPILVFGGELELRREWRQGWMFGATYSLQRARYDDSKLPAASKLREVPNSPTQLASVKGAFPIIGKSLTLGTRLSILSSAADLQNRQFCGADAGGKLTPCPTQQRTDLGLDWDVVLGGEAERYGLRYSLGLYNAADWKYDSVASAEFSQRTIRQPGRTLMASLSWNIDLPFLEPKTTAASGAESVAPSPSPSPPAPTSAPISPKAPAPETP
jgi:outer membrane receptor protein involved in Fe transport